jgi:hypothetical protein
MLKTFHAFVATLGLNLVAGTANACPFCNSQTADKVRAGIFNEHFIFHVVASLAPFPVLIGILLMIYFGPAVVVRKLLALNSPPSKAVFQFVEVRDKHD